MADVAGGPSLLELLIRRGGVIKAARVAEFVWSWAVALDRADDDELAVTEYIAYWRATPRTTYRRLAEFRELLPELGPEATPQRVAAEVLRLVADVERRQWAVLGAVPSAAVLASA